MAGKAHHTAVAVVPPEEVWGPIQAIRRRYDRQIHRWMPHINLLYPFRPRVEFEAAAPALAGRPSSEVNRRLTALVEKWAAATPTPEDVRAIRIVEALEWAGTAAARRLLTDLAAGAAEARLTREAKAALQRLPHKHGEER